MSHSSPSAVHQPRGDPSSRSRCKESSRIPSCPINGSRVTFRPRPDVLSASVTVAPPCGYRCRLPHLLSIKSLQDWRCLWCACTVHDGCLAQLGRGCNLGPFSISCVPPLAVKEVSADGEYKFRWDAIGRPSSRSFQTRVCRVRIWWQQSSLCDGQLEIRGQPGPADDPQVQAPAQSHPNIRHHLLRTRFRPLPVQVPRQLSSACLRGRRHRRLGVDGHGSPRPPQKGGCPPSSPRYRPPFQCQLAVLPLGTGNDLARVLGWGHAFYNVHELPSLLQEIERAPTSMLDR